MGHRDEVQSDAMHRRERPRAALIAGERLDPLPDRGVSLFEDQQEVSASGHWRRDHEYDASDTREHPDGDATDHHNLYGRASGTPPWRPPRRRRPNPLGSAAMDYRVRIDSRTRAIFVIVALIVLLVLGWKLTDWL
jgi:hypothetical protein